MPDDKHTYKFRNPNLRLNTAIKILETFTKKHTPQKKNIFDIAKDLISFSKKPEKVDEDLLDAIEDVKRFHPILLQENSVEGEQLASTIHRYNEILNHSHEKESQWHNKILKFLSKKFPIHLSKIHRIKIEHHPPLYKSSPHLFEFPKIEELPALSKERDLFRMKAISLIKDHPLLFPSIAHTMASLHQSPIFVAASDDPECPSMITLEQKLTPFPGETVVVRGSFKRDPHSLTPTTPLPNTFEISTESTQTGFPHPSQHNGWALSDRFIPLLPLRPEKTDLLLQLLEKKENIAHCFLMKDDFIDKSRTLLESKSTFAKQNKEEFLSLHLNLNLALLKDPIPVKAFYSWLKDQKATFEALSEIHTLINSLFIEEPKKFLVECWIKQTNDALYSDDVTLRLNTAKAIYLDALSESAKVCETLDKNPVCITYIKSQGMLLGSSFSNIFLQYFSEMLEIPPPELSPFEKKLQTLAFHQQESFYNELTSQSSCHSFDALKRSILEDTALLEPSAECHPLCEELETYYHDRYLAFQNKSTMGATVRGHNDGCQETESTT